MLASFSSCFHFIIYFSLLCLEIESPWIFSQQFDQIHVLVPLISTVALITTDHHLQPVLHHLHTSLHTQYYPVSPSDNKHLPHSLKIILSQESGDHVKSNLAYNYKHTKLLRETWYVMRSHLQFMCN